MLIALDEQIQFGLEAFRTIGDVRALPSGSISPATLKDADMLVVRSVTRVDRNLLEGSSLRLVGSVTSGVDHIDLNYLRNRGICFAHAPGCNATSVAEYVMAALRVLKRILPPDGGKLGLVGLGHVGRLVEKKARGLGIAVSQSDAPLASQSADARLVPLDALMDCDVLTLHVPLIEDGPFRTRQLFDEERLRKMKRGSVLINTSRGEVVDESALASCLRDGHLAGAVVDVWADEPLINPALLERVTIGTPHVAGYSLEGRIAGTAAVYQAACHFLRIPATWEGRLPEPKRPVLDITIGSENALAAAIAAAYDIEADDARLRNMLRLPRAAHSGHFQDLRTNYPVRREFSSLRVRGKGSDAAWKNKLLALGFGVDGARGLANPPPLERTS